MEREVKPRKANKVWIQRRSLAPHAYSAKRSLTQDISDSYISYVNLSPLDKLKTLRALRDQCFSQPLFVRQCRINGDKCGTTKI